MVVLIRLPNSLLELGSIGSMLHTAFSGLLFNLPVSGERLFEEDPCRCYSLSSRKESGKVVVCQL